MSIVFFLSVLVCSVMLISCERRGDDTEAAEAQVLLPKAQKDLARAKSNLNSLREQLQAVQHERDLLAQQVGELTTARDNAVNTAQTVDKSIDNMTAKINEQSERISFLENEIDELNAVVEVQRATIAEQQGTIAELVSFIKQKPIPEEQEEVIDKQNENY